MSFTLIDQSSENFEFRANVWNWKAALEIIKSFDLVSEGKIRQMSYNATGVAISPEDANMIGQKIRETIIPKLQPGFRMFANLSISESKDDGTIFKDEDEQWKNYSVDAEWLNEFSDFCTKSKGFQIY